MIIFAQFMLIIWPIFSIYWFQKKDAREAVLLSVIMGVMFLPNYMIDLPFIIYNKNTVIGISVLLGDASSKRNIVYKKSIFDNVMILYCFISAILTAIVNGFGLYEGIVISAEDFFVFGAVFIAGRKYFRTEDDLKLLTRYLVIGVLIYLPLCWYELRMSPQLHTKLYGFFQHSWTQGLRYGGYRPIVFMTHGLMVSFWIMVGTVALFWLWRSKAMKDVFGIPVVILFVLCFITLLLSKSKGALFLGVLGILVWFIYKRKMIESFFLIAITFTFIYFLLRILNSIDINDLANMLSYFFDEDRLFSAIFRFRSEDLITQSVTLSQTILGKHRWGRGLGLDPYTGRAVIVDSLWIVTYGARGLLGLFSQFLLIFSGPISIIKTLRTHNAICLEAIILSILIILFAFDCLVNAMMNPVYILCTGALVSYAKLIEKGGIVNLVNRISAD